MNINCLCRSIVFVCLLASCQKNEVADVNVAVTNSAPVVATPAVTKDDWNKALSSSAIPFGPEKKEDGLRFYSACFGPVANNKCIEPHLYEYEAEYDSFKRVYFQQPLGGYLQWSRG
ncbi:MAG: hypothetical protein IPL70_08930 [Uliginosibacterium sp.]|nr:hypothetical protein [Uliginosibacterium sp.]